MAELKTKKNNASVSKFLKQVTDKQKQKDSFAILELMKQVTKEEPKMWGSAIVGFGQYSYEYSSGQKGDWPIVAFSPRKQNLSVYIMSGFEKREELLSKLGKHKTGKACLYINKLEEVNVTILKKLIAESVHYMKKKYSVK